MRGEHSVLAVGLGLVVLGAYQLCSNDPLNSWGLFRYKLRRLKVGAARLKIDAVTAR